MQEFSAFRLGDIRGIYPEEINESLAAAFAHSFVGHFGLAGKIATGRDMRNSSESLHTALNDTLAAIGIDVIDIGLCPTELGYFASTREKIEAAIIVTASHNPADYNGFKCVLKNGRAISFDSGLAEIKSLMSRGYRHPAGKGSVTRTDFHSRFLEFLLSQFPRDEIAGGQVALNGLNGTAATMASEIATELELPVTWFRKQPGPIPAQGADPANPMLAEEMKKFMSGNKFSLGVAWDGDCDRCVCFDEDGTLVPTYYLIGLLAEEYLVANPGGAIVFDTKLCWNTIDVIERYGGTAVVSESGHAFMKQKMHEHNAVYGGELSSHHYFGDFFGCDSGMFTWLTVLRLVNSKASSLKELIASQKSNVCCTPETNVKLIDPDAAFAQLLNKFSAKAIHVDHFDGLSFSMPGDWRFSIRRSKTEPLVRLNFEARGSAETLLEEGRKVFDVLDTYRADDENWLANFAIQ